MQLIKEIRSVEYLDKRKYRFTFLDNTVKYIVSVTTKLEEYREKGIEVYRENVGSEEADRALQEGGEWGSIVHHACFILATGGAVLYEPPAYQTVGIQNEEVSELIKQNALVRRQLDLMKIPHLTINDQFRYLQCKKFKHWIDVVKPEVLYAETVVYDFAEGPNDTDIAGRMDFLFKVQGGHYPIAGAKDIYLPKGIILPDVKSGAWSNKAYLQMGAYRRAVKKSLGIEVDATVGIHLKAATNSGLNTLVHNAEEADHDLELFKHVAAIYDDKHKNDTPQEFEFESVLLGTKANDVILGATLDNPIAQEMVAKETIGRVNAATGDAELTGQLEESLAVQEPPKAGNGEGLEYLRPKKGRKG